MFLWVRFNLLLSEGLLVNLPLLSSSCVAVCDTPRPYYAHLLYNASIGAILLLLPASLRTAR